MTTPLHEDDDQTAAEYVLGTLPLEDRTAAARRIGQDPAFAAAVRAWEDRFAALNDDYAEAPAPDLLPAIEARLFPAPPPKPRRFGWLGWLSGAASAAALVVLVSLALPIGQPALVTEIVAANAAFQYEARFDGTRLVVRRSEGAAAPAAEVHELWIIAPDQAPVSLGLLGDAPLEIDYPIPPEGWVLAISLEPAGGSPTGAPTGPVLATAEIRS
ncbi:anti-sigma factor [Neotabrizicola shimadae]|uniref:Anti-sigma factor n=1 Tax=Neotabrizicola shimadae TaxID=2807096 RepID=A0A8G1EDA4_9RHOB|nr:anti-sigma factor [Neotabrizicola shimadae]QYZ71322.1 anti-sigma factor [Neotabrizicola shimadae]